MSPERGLSQAEAAARLAAEGPNELPQANARSLLRIAFDVVREPMFGLLLAAGIRSAPGVFVVPIEKEMGWPRSSDVSNIFPSVVQPV